MTALRFRALVLAYRQEEHLAPCLRALAPHVDRQTTFYRHRHPSGHVLELPESFFYWHFGYVLSDERLWEKLHTFGHAHEIVPRWFEEKWLQWTPATRDLFFMDSRWRWPGTIKIDARSLPRIMHDHRTFRRTVTPVRSDRDARES